MKKRVRITESQLRKLIREAIVAEVGPLDQMVPKLSTFMKTMEEVVEMTPPGKTRAVLTGLHSDLFNLVAEFRKLIEQAKEMIRKSSQKN